MKKVKSLTAFLFLLFAALANFESCSKPKLQDLELNSAKQFYTALISGDSVTIYSYVWLSGDQVVAATDSSFHIAATAAFTDSITGNLVPNLGLNINSRSLLPGPKYTYSFGYSDTIGYLQEGLNLFGTNVKVKITGSTLADTVTQSIYMPKKVMRYSKDLPLGQVDITKSLTLNWLTDPACSWGNVEIILFYNAAKSIYLNDPSLPAHDTALSYTVPDNGSFTISATDLQKLKKNSAVILSLGRGSTVQAVLPVSKKRVLYYATSSVSTFTLTLVVPVPNVNLDGYDTKNIGYSISLTNLATNAVYNFSLYPNSNYAVLGQIPPGYYNVVFSPLGSPSSSTFTFNGNIKTGTSATFSDMAVTTTSYAAIH